MLNDALPPLTDETLWAILNDTIADATVNALLWQGLGYRYDAEQQQWSTDQVPEDWRSDYPEPPDFIESRPAIVKLTRSIPREHKQLLKEELGFKGYSIDELVPRKTRRATAVNWFLSHRQSGS
ncbi:MAG: DUF1823 family protein [Prochlorotrichaceae cyanobacterium]|jgi:hypothetical protein